MLSPSAEYRATASAARHRRRQKNVAIARIEPIGNYAVRIVFDDGHDTGVYVWDYLRELRSPRDALARLSQRPRGQTPLALRAVRISPLCSGARFRSMPPR